MLHLTCKHLCPEPLQQAQAVVARQHQVQHQHIRPELADQISCPVALGAGTQLAVSPEQFLQRTGQLFGAFGNKQLPLLQGRSPFQDSFLQGTTKTDFFQSTDSNEAGRTFCAPCR